MKVDEIYEILFSIERKHYDRVYDVLAQTDMDINQEGRNGFTPLICAIQRGDVKVTEVFLKMGANPNGFIKENEYPSALHYAIKLFNDCIPYRADYIQMIELLVKHGARECEDRNNETALHLAARIGDVHIAKLLIQYGFNPIALNKKNQTPIEIAIENNHQAIAHYLASCSCEDVYLDKIVKAGVINETELNEYSAIFQQIQNQRQLPPEVVEKIKFFTFYNPAKREEMNCTTGIMQAIKNNSEKQLQNALSSGYLLYDMQDNEGSLLEQAIKNESPKIASLLVKFGSIISDNLYDSANDEIREILLTEKRKQMQILKDGLQLENKKPLHCTL